MKFRRFRVANGRGFSDWPFPANYVDEFSAKTKKQLNRYYVLVGMVQQKGMFCNFFRFTKTVKIYFRKLFFDPTKAGYPPPCKQALS